VRLLREFDHEADGDLEVPDPYYGGPDGFDRVFEMVDRSCPEPPGGPGGGRPLPGSRGKRARTRGPRRPLEPLTASFPVPDEVLLEVAAALGGDGPPDPPVEAARLGGGCIHSRRPAPDPCRNRGLPQMVDPGRSQRLRGGGPGTRGPPGSGRRAGAGGACLRSRGRRSARMAPPGVDPRGTGRTGERPHAGGGARHPAPSRTGVEPGMGRERLDRLPSPAQPLPSRLARLLGRSPASCLAGRPWPRPSAPKPGASRSGRSPRSTGCSRGGTRTASRFCTGTSGRATCSWTGMGSPSSSIRPSTGATGRWTSP
jgi:hypothetical protein